MTDGSPDGPGPAGRAGVDASDGRAQTREDMKARVSKIIVAANRRRASRPPVARQPGAGSSVEKVGLQAGEG